MPDETTDPAATALEGDGAAAQPETPSVTPPPASRTRRPAPAVVPRHLRPDAPTGADATASEPAPADSLAGRLEELEARLSAEPAPAEPAPAKKAPVKRAPAKKASPTSAAPTASAAAAETTDAPTDVTTDAAAAEAPVGATAAGDAPDLDSPTEALSLPPAEPVSAAEPAPEAEAPTEPTSADTPTEAAAEPTVAAPVKKAGAKKAPAKKAPAAKAAPVKAPAKKAAAAKAPAVDLAPPAAVAEDASIDDLMGGEVTPPPAPVRTRRPVSPPAAEAAAATVSSPTYRPATELVPAQRGAGPLWALAALLLAVAVGLGVAALVRGQEHVWEAKSLVTLTPGSASSVNQVDALRDGQERYAEKASNDSFTAVAALKANMPQDEIREKVEVVARGGDQLAITARASTGKGALSLANASGVTLAATVVSGEALLPNAGDRLGAVVVGPSPEAIRTSPTDTEILVAGLLGGAAVLLLAGVLTLVRRSNAPR